MNLMDNKITIGELTQNAEAHAILKREFPQFANPIMLRLGRSMKLSEVLELAHGHVAPEKVQAALDALRAV